MNIKSFIYMILIVIIISLVIKKNYINNKKQIKSPKELELTYKINAGIPFKWEYVIEDETIAKFVKKYVVRDDNTGAKTGASIYTNYVFKGLKEGKTTITFKYVNFVNNISYEEEKNIIKVDKDNNISLIQKKKEK